MRSIFGQLIETRCVRLEQGCHLVNKCTRTARASTVHALLNAVIKIDNLSVLTAQLNGAVGLRNQSFYRALRGDNFLNKFKFQPLCQQQTTGTSN